MSDPVSIIAMGGSVLAVTALLTFAALRAFADYMQLKRRELDAQVEGELAPTGGLIEIADLRERVRKLEAIAAGIDP